MMLASLLQSVHDNDAVSEYVVAEVRRRRATREPRRATRGHIVEGHATVFHDHTRGRGRASTVIPISRLDDVRELIDRAAARASLGAGPSWQLPPPAAPARVDVSDEALAGDVDAAASRIAALVQRAIADGGAVAKAAGESVRAADLKVWVEHRGIALRTSTGFHGRYEATCVEVRVTLAPKKKPDRARVARIALARRRAADLDLERHLINAAKRLRDLANAAPAEPGQYDLALAGPALFEPCDRGFGWFDPIVAQADGTAARQGLTRYLPGQPVFRDTEVSGDALTIHSDGTLPYGTASEPFGPLAEPVRRFALVEAGAAAGLALDVREAGLRSVSPNGGVRNLIVEPGTLAKADELAGDRAPVLHVVAMRSLTTDARSGTFAGEIDLAYLDGNPIRGGLVRGDLYRALAGARFSTDVEFHGWYKGPRLIRLPNVALL